jgi:tetraacyldisaccharide 4'-kinase
MLPTVVSKSRVAGAKFAVAQGAQLIIIDDGFQNPTLHKDCSLIVIDAKHGFGNGRIVPAGPLREYPAEGLARAQAIILTNVPQSLPELPAGIPVFTATANFADDMETLKGKKYVAFSGIAYPQKFFDTLAALEADIAETIPFPDHYFFSDSDIASLLQKAQSYNATLITTAKDAVRLPAQIRGQVEILPIKMAIHNPERLTSLLEKFLPL